MTPTTGCTVFGGDGGVDTVESPNGIVCSGGMAADDPLCTEQFASTMIAALKVVPEPGYTFRGWTVNGAHVQTAAAPLFLSTMPVLAQAGSGFTPTPFDGNTATTAPYCSPVSLTVQAVTFSGMPTEIDCAR